MGLQDEMFEVAAELELHSPDTSEAFEAVCKAFFEVEQKLGETEESNASLKTAIRVLQEGLNKPLEVTTENNFCRVFQLPKNYPEGFLFSGGVKVPFEMVDWFQPIPTSDLYTGKVKAWAEYVPFLKNFIRQKNYVRRGKFYLLVTDFQESLIVQGDLAATH